MRYLCVLLYRQPLEIPVPTVGRRIFNVRNDVNAHCAHEGERGSDECARNGDLKEGKLHRIFTRVQQDAWSVRCIVRIHTQGSSSALERRHTNTTTKTRVAYGKSHLAYKVHNADEEGQEFTTLQGFHITISSSVYSATFFLPPCTHHP